MCGIWGSNHEIFDDHSLGAMRRGLDGSSSKKLKSIRFGHSLLSISSRPSFSNRTIPLLPHSTDNTLLTYNGEIFSIYSKRIISNDTLELINAFGDLCEDNILKDLPVLLNNFNGFFAIAYFVARSKTVYLIRDRFGQKPLYYSYHTNKYFFSSSALDCLYWRDPKYSYSSPLIHENRGGGLYIDEINPFPGVYQVPPGSFVKLQEISGQIIQSIHQWYFPVKRQSTSVRLSYTEFEDKCYELHDLLLDSIKLRSSCDAVISLSGGIDSTLLAAMYSRNIGSIPAFTLNVQDDQFSEISTVKKVANYLQIPLNIISNDFTFSDLIKSVYLLEMPSFNCSFIGFGEYYKQMSMHTRVCIEGHGADELFGGYPNFLRQLVVDYIFHSNFKRTHLLFSSLKDITETNNVQALISIIKGLLLNLTTKSSTEKLLIEFFTKTSLPMVLRTFDRIQIESGVEGRSPFLDYRVVEFIQNQSLDFLYYKGIAKSPLKYLLDKEYNLLQFLPKKKIGFTSSYKTLFQMFLNHGLTIDAKSARQLDQGQIFNSIIGNYSYDDSR